MIRLLLVDDHACFRQPLAAMLEGEPDISVVAQAGTSAEAREAIQDLPPEGIDVALVDIYPPDGDEGAELVRDLRAASPRTPTLVLNAYSSGREQFARVVEAGAGGVLDKRSGMEDIAEAIRRLHSGERLIPLEEVLEMTRLAARLRERDYRTRLAIGQITPRESEVLRALAEGSRDKDISERLGVSVPTVRSHLRHILDKLGAESRTQALVFAVRRGIVEVKTLDDD